VLRAAVELSLLGHLILILSLLGSHDLESSKPRAPSRPVDQICPGRFQTPTAAGTVQIPICLNTDDLGRRDASVEQAVIVIQGRSRDAVAYHAAIEAARRRVERHDVLVVAPQFVTSEDLEPLDPPPALTTWGSADWSQGDRSDGGASPARISSFELVDRLVEEIARRDQYANLKQITIAGHSAGGQFVQRYAAGTRIDQRGEIPARRIGVRYIVANPSSYMNLFPREPTAATQGCRGVNEYRYGLNDLNAYLRPIGPEGIRAAYAQKEVTLLLGRLDNQLLDPTKDDSCEAMAQGAHRLGRGIAFLAHLDTHLGREHHRTRRVVVPGVGHNARAMFNSPEGLSALFGP